MDKGKQKVHDKLFSEVVKSALDDHKNSSSSRDVNLPLLSRKPNKQAKYKLRKKYSKIKSVNEAGQTSTGELFECNSGIPSRWTYYIGFAEDLTAEHKAYFRGGDAAAQATTRPRTRGSSKKCQRRNTRPRPGMRARV